MPDLTKIKCKVACCCESKCSVNSDTPPLSEIDENEEIPKIKYSTSL